MNGILFYLSVQAVHLILILIFTKQKSLTIANNFQQSLQENLKDNYIP